MFILKERQDGSPLVIAGPCWPFCTFVTVPLIVVLSSLVAYFIVLNEDSGLVSLVGCYEILSYPTTLFYSIMNKFESTQYNAMQRNNSRGGLH